MGEGRTPSTKNARTVDQRGAGTGQHVAARVDVGEGLRFPRITDSPAKITGSQPKMSDKRRGEDAFTGLTPPAMERNAKMVKDSGPKTSRESDFNGQMKDRMKELGGTGDRQFYPTAYESQKARIAKSDDNAGAETGYRAKKAQ